MKKLLSLLSVLTISGTAVPTTIAASPYQKEKNLNSDINYQQTNNNLENLNRYKRRVGQGSWNNNELFSQEEYNLNFKKSNLSSQLNRVKRETLEEKINWQNQQINYLLTETTKINNKLKEMGESSRIALSASVISAVTAGAAAGLSLISSYYAGTTLATSVVATVVGGSLISVAIPVFTIIAGICAIIAAA